MSSTPPSGAIDLDMWRSLLNMETPISPPRIYVGMLLMADRQNS